jgi:hypothetical protein
MIILGILLTFVALSFLCWVLFQLAALALPFFAAVTAGRAVIQAGGGVLGALFLGLFAGILTLVAGQLVFTIVPSARVRLAVAIIFVVPAAVAGYHAAHGLMGFGTSSEAWRIAVGSLGGVFVGASALARLVIRVAPSASSQLAPA